MKLRRKSVAKPWGQDSLPAVFGSEKKRRIGEIWFEPPKGVTPALLAKYLFTSEKLSIQVHPNQRQARRQGYPSGKDECWFVVDAHPGAVLGLGLKKEVSPTKLHAAVACGQLEALVDWKPVSAGDYYYVPAGTIHAIGAGITIVEIQQNVDVTYRLYDYGRPRELHLEEAIPVATPAPYDMKHHIKVDRDQSVQLQNGPYFQIFQILGNDTSLINSIAASEWQIIPLEGKMKARGKVIAAGECGLCTKSSEIDLTGNVRSLIACTMQ